MSINIAVIGGGITGIGILKSLIDYNYKVYLFEKNEIIGGLWDYNKFFDLKIQTNSKHYRYYDKPHKKNLHYMSAKKILEYIQDYVDYNDLNKNIFLNYNAEAIKFGSKHKIKNNNNGIFFNILFDYVIYATSKERVIPNLFKNDEISNKILFPDMLSESLLKKLNNKKIVVYGGSKSAMDMAYSLKKNTSADIVLISRSFNNFARSCKYNTVKIQDIISAIFKCILAGISNITSSVSSKKKDIILLGIETIFNLDITNGLGNDGIGTGNILSNDEYMVLKNINKYKNSIIKINKNNIILDNQDKLTYDNIFLCLGYNTNNELPKEASVIIPTIFLGVPVNEMLESSIKAYLINTYIKSKYNDFDLFSKKKIKGLQFYIIFYKLIYLLFDIKLPTFQNFIIFFSFKKIRWLLMRGI